MSDDANDGAGRCSGTSFAARLTGTRVHGVPLLLTAGLHVLFLSLLVMAFQIVFRHPQRPAEKIVSIPLSSGQPNQASPKEQRASAPRPTEPKMPASAPAIVLPLAALEKRDAPLPTPGMSAHGGAGPIDTERYRQSLHDHIARARLYPQEAVRGRLEGTTLVAFLLRRDGSVSDLAIARSSGLELLDEAASDAVRRAEPFPAIPANLPENLDITVPIVFALDGRGQTVAMRLP